MDKRTESSKLEELEQALDMFCAHEYKNSKPSEKMTGKDFTLFAADSGGYDITSNVSLRIKDGKIKLTVSTEFQQWNVVKTKKFELKLVE